MRILHSFLIIVGFKESILESKMIANIINKDKIVLSQLRKLSSKLFSWIKSKTDFMKGDNIFLKGKMVKRIVERKNSKNKTEEICLNFLLFLIVTWVL